MLSVVRVNVGGGPAITYEQQQNEAQIPSDERVVVSLVKRAEKSRLLKGRSKVMPIVAFVATMLFVFTLAFLLENVRPRQKADRTAPADPTVAGASPPEEA